MDRKPVQSSQNRVDVFHFLSFTEKSGSSVQSHWFYTDTCKKTRTLTGCIMRQSHLKVTLVRPRERGGGLKLGDRSQGPFSFCWQFLQQRNIEKLLNLTLSLTVTLESCKWPGSSVRITSWLSGEPYFFFSSCFSTALLFPLLHLGQLTTYCCTVTVSLCNF